ncbi:MAG: nucleoid-associated protein [Chryseobacterium sp.]|nr:MAG: nucleoid-associated protein [Chryseobacterium sp.]
MLNKISIHKVGNKTNNEALHLAAEPTEIAEELSEILGNYFLGAFKSEEQFRFYHDSYLELNDVFSFADKIFEDPTTLHEQSQNIAKFLYEQSKHPRIKGGELYVVYFEGEETQAGKIDSVGIFKSENKDTFLKIYPKNEAFEIERDQGINISRLDKGCIIYNTDKETGYAVSVVDNNKNGDAQYWFDDFLHVKQRDDDYFHTEKTLAVCKEYIMKQLPEEFETTRVDQVDLLNKSIAFFKEKEQFDFDEFTSEVLEDKNVIESFLNYKTDYEQEYQLNISEDFAINNAAVKKQNRIFKSVIKLDKNFHIYVHGDRNMIEQGADDKGKYYRLYYEVEN